MSSHEMLNSLNETNSLLQTLIDRLDRLESTNTTTHQQLSRIGEQMGGIRTRVAMLSQLSLMPLREELIQVIISKQLDYPDTLRHIRDNRMSFARFGDGEFLLISDYERHLGFQPNSPELQRALEEILLTPPRNLLIGMPDRLHTLHWEKVWPRVWPKIRTLLREDTIYGNADVSRKFCFQLHGLEGVSAWRQIWENRDVTLVYGRGSRFSAIPELFDCAASIRRIESTPTDAFSDLDRLEAEVLDSGPDIVLVALGPAATVLARRLHDSGVQTLDIGHLSASYLEHFSGGPTPERTPFSQ